MQSQNPDKKKIIALLKEHSPAFQLQSGIQELPSSEGFLANGPRATDNLKRKSHASSLALLEYLTVIIKPGFVTLETGGGWSTCVFAACAARHICVNPDITANRLIQSFLDTHAVQHGNIEFANDTSDRALPRLFQTPTPSIDVALIDGNHSFPIPVVDWHYIDLVLRKGGILLVDDTNVKSVAVLCDYLSSELSYKKCKEIERTAVYEKIRENRVWGWADQGYNQKSNDKHELPPATLKVDRQKELLNAEIVITFFTQTKRRYALFGAGKVANQIIEMISAKKLMPPIFVLDNTPGINTFQGLSVILPHQIPKMGHIDEIILATTCFQDNMRSELKAAGCNLNPVDLRANLIPEPTGQSSLPKVTSTTVSETSKVRDTATGRQT
ncbi:MAG: hypothetical protein A2283_02050 [Lentisphaerae bacterium RIFOXYA12_FULL_48_11]|nr:MAG: hypothetical protein A2283_02050 [Lentisphaerae bacterium RIFOXYA12_FULL_48_11]